MPDPLLSECPVCGAEPGELCRTPQGYPNPNPHTRRFADDEWRAWCIAELDRHSAEASDGN